MMSAPRRQKAPLRITRYYCEDPAAVAAAVNHAVDWLLSQRPSPEGQVALAAAEARPTPEPLRRETPQ